MVKAVFLSILAMGAVAQPEQGQVGLIDFYGYKGIGVDAVRAALPIREGDEFPGTRSPEEWKRAIRASVLGLIGREPSDVSVVCCAGERKYLIYIGLPGASSKPIRYNRAPQGNVRFPPDVVKLYEAMGTALMAAVTSGNAREDDSQGFALADDPALRASQMAIREYALKNESVIFRVMESSSDAGQRAIAAEALGYARASSRQVAGLVRASLDPDGEVRNNAVRALGVLLGASPKFAREVPTSSCFQLLASPTWSDRNKGAALFEVLTRRRDPELLRQLRATALDNLLEMARWRSVGHAGFARLLIGRIAGIQEDRLRELARSDQVEAIINGLTIGR
jgi:hypothetical protein